MDDEKQDIMRLMNELAFQTGQMAGLLSRFRRNPVLLKNLEEREFTEIDLIELTSQIWKLAQIFYRDY